MHRIESTPKPPPLAFRVGITGARRLRPDQVSRIRLQVDRLLTTTRAELQNMTPDPMVRDFYEPENGEEPVCHLRFVSPLARGADRLAASVGLKRGYDLCVPMPFAQAAYEEDFHGSDPARTDEEPLSAEDDVREFRELLAGAGGTFVLDGAREAASPNARNDIGDRSYEYVGRFVVKHCDLLLAIWDGEPGNGRGGTADIVRYAANVGVPIWWIHATKDRDPLWIADWQDMLYPRKPETRAEDCLHAYLKHHIPAPPHQIRRHHNWIGRLGELFRRQYRSRAEIYFRDKSRPPRRWWKTYATAIDLASRLNLIGEKVQAFVWRRAAPAGMPLGDAESEHVTDAWSDFYAKADERAKDYAARYRSSYVWVIVFATLSLVAGAAASLYPLSPHAGYRRLAICLATVELLTPLFVVLLVGVCLRREWHERSIEYRLLAELFRKQQALANLGSALSIGHVEQLADVEHLAWVGWFFSAVQRAVPFPTVDFSDLKQRKSARRLLIALIDEQLSYHRRREWRTDKAGATLERLGGWLFLGVFVFAAAKVAAEVAGDRIRWNPWHWNTPLLLGFWATVLPAISAAFVGFRSYAELELLAEQSRHMIFVLQRARERVERLDLDCPLVSQDLSALGLSVATMMLQDLEGWGRLFRGKLMEPA